MRQNQDIKPSQVLLARSVATTDSASFVFDTRGYSSATLSAQVLDLVAVRGSNRASSWISDVKNTTGFVDIIMIGDSNIGFSQYGISTGLVHALCTVGASQYASCLFEVWNGSHDSEHGCPSADGTNQEGFRSFGDEVNYTSSVAALTTSGGTVGQAPATTRSNFSLGGSQIQAFSNAESNGLFVASGNTFLDVNLGMNNQGIGAAVGESLHRTDEVKFRLYYASEATGGKVWFRILPVGAGSETLEDVSLANSAGELAYIENPNTIPANSSRTSLTFHIAGGGVGAFSAIVGPGAFFWQTVYRPNATSGFAVQPFEYYGGRKLSEMATDVSRASGGWLKQYMKAVVQRQQTPGGLGRVIFWIQGGTNLDSSAVVAAESIQSIINSVRSAWASAGYAADRLAFVANITHQVNDPDNLADRRVRLRELTQFNDDLTVIEPQMLESYAEANATADGTHQTRLGYNRQCRRWVDALILHGASAVTPSTVTIEHGDTTAAFSSIPGLTSGTDFSISSVGTTSRPTVIASVDMRGKKRYLRLSVKPGQLADVAAYCVLAEPADSPVTASEAGTSTRVIK